MAVSMRAQSAHNAASRGDVSLLTELIGQPPDKQVLNAKTAAGWSLLHTIAQHDHDKVAVNIFMDDKWLDPNLRALREETPLHVCAIYGSPKVCLWLLNAKADPVMKDTNEWTPIHYAARFGHKDVLEMLRREHRSQVEQTIRDSFRSEKALSRPGAAAQGTSRTVHDADANTYIDPVTNDHWTPLHVAARFEQTDIITYLLTSGAAKEAKDKQGWTALHVAVRFGLSGVVQHLINHRLDVDARTEKNESCGHIALQHGHTNLVEMLLLSGMNIETRNLQGETLLHLAARLEGGEVVETLATRGALLQAKDTNGYCALHIAAEAGNLEAIQVLIAHGCDIDVRDNEGGSWLFLLNKEHYSQVTKILVSANARTGRLLNGPRMILKGTSLIYTHEMEEVSKSVSCDRHFAMIKYVSRMAAGDTQGEDHKEAQELLFYACEYGHSELIAFLIHQGTDIRAQDPDGLNGMHIAAKNGNVGVITLFLSNGMEMDSTDDMCWTPLHHACCAGQHRVVDFLLEKKANVNAQNDQKETPLHLAFGNGHMEIIRLLMQAEPAADRSIRDAVGFAPVDYATTELKDRMGEDLRPRGGPEEIEDKGTAGEEEAAGEGGSAPKSRCVLS